ncbi:MAG: Crp/Fnr family transcriptional regulator [Chitinophagaceae bacterium]
MEESQHYDLIHRKMGFLGKDLIDNIAENALVKDIPAGAEILHEGQYVNHVPILLSGLLKVYTRQEDKELLLYYIQPFESCVMSFIAGLRQEKSKVYALSVEDSVLVLLPSASLQKWIYDYPRLNLLYYQQFDLRYTELIGTINHLLFDKLDKRIFGFLKERADITGKNPVKISHRELANELGTAREVVSRLVKKLEKEGKLKQNQDSIEIL